MAGAVGRRRSVASADIESTCVALLTELEAIWSEIGESEMAKDRMLMELERECMQVYRRKVKEASNARARLHQTVATKEAELAALRACLMENSPPSPENKSLTLKEHIASLTPALEELRLEKEERFKLFTEIQMQIEKINREITGQTQLKESAGDHGCSEKLDLSLRKINECQAQLRTLQKEKSDRLHKVLEHVNEVHHLCEVLGMDFYKTLGGVHPSLHEIEIGQAASISNKTIDGLVHVISKLKAEKKLQFQKLRGSLSSLYDLWNLMNSPEEDTRCFRRIISIMDLPEDDVKECGILSPEILQQVANEVDRLSKLKAGRLKELVFKRREDLEEICAEAHIQPDISTSLDKINALIDSNMVDPSELLTSIEAHITNAREEFISRKDIMDRISKWLMACEEEKWLEDYDQDHKKYNAGRGAHLNLKRAELARITVNKIPGIVDNLMKRIFHWEDERNTLFLYDGVRLISILEEYKLSRHKKEEEKRRYRTQKKLQEALRTEKEAMYGSKSTVKRCNSLNRKNGSVDSTSRRTSPGSSDLLTPRSQSGRQNGYFK